MSIKDLTFIIKAKDATSRVISNVSNKLAGIGKTISSKIGGTAIRALKAFAVAVAIASIASIKLASDAQEIDDKLNRVYGNMAENAKKFSKEYARTIGKSTTEIKGMMAELGELGISMGMNSEEALNFSKRVTKLSQDLAAAKKIKVEEAMDIVTKATRGNTKEFERLGYSLKKNTIDQKAVALGYAKTTKAITNEARALAALNLMEAQTKAIQNEADKYRATYNGNLENSKARLHDLSVEFGNQIIQGLRLAELYDYLAKKFTSFTDTLERTQIVKRALSSVSNGFNEIRKEVNTLSDGLVNLYLNAKYGKQIKEQKASIKRMQELQELKGVQNSIDAAQKALEQYREMSRGAAGINVSPGPTAIPSASKLQESFQTYDMAEYLRQIAENTSKIEDITKGPGQG